MQSSTQINATKARMDKEVLALRAKSIFFKTLKYLSLIVASIVFLLPIVTIFLASFKEYNEFYSSNKLALPQSFFNLDNFKTAFIQGGMMRGFFNTAFIMVISLTGTILLGAMVAYVLHRFDFKLKKAILLVSADLSEILSLSDTILVMHEGRIVGHISDVKNTSENELGLYMLGVKEDSKEQIGGAYCE